MTSTRGGHSVSYPTALRSMIKMLQAEQVVALASALQGHLTPERNPTTRRVAQLWLVSLLLDEVPQQPNTLPHVNRSAYDERREMAERPAPPSRELVELYGTWTRACWAGWGLQMDGRSAMGGKPWAATRPGVSRHASFTPVECAASLRQCADEIGRIPSSHDYDLWSRRSRHAAREAGHTARIASNDAILRELAPLRSGRDGWRIACRRVFD